ncbi:MAG: DMT family transporter [Lachnospiraceae bacterium]|nr:DMT family transporter [Lachnospiraceae bacterium]
MAALGRITASMAIFGTVGIFIKNIPFPSAVIALGRGIIGSVFLLLSAVVSKKALDVPAIKKNLKLLILSGIAIGVNWILLFESYKYIPVSTATLCYYLSPVFVTLASPVVLKEKLTGTKLACVGAALLGMVLISGVLQGDAAAGGQFTGILLACGAAVLYATVVLLNKFIKDIPANDCTVMQLGTVAVVLLPYVLLTENLGSIDWNMTHVVMLIFVGILHTGIAYKLYFGAVPYVEGQTIALISYVDPVITIILSAIVLGEPLTVYSIAGAVLILGSTMVGELVGKR